MLCSDQPASPGMLLLPSSLEPYIMLLFIMRFIYVKSMYGCTTGRPLTGTKNKVGGKVTRGLQYIRIHKGLFYFQDRYN